MAYTSKKDLVKTLVDDYDYVQTILEKQTKEELITLLESLDKGEVDMTPESENNVGDTEEKGVDIPSIGDYEWHSYVMGHFHKDELMEGNPTVDGMRRIVENLVGEIINVATNVVGLPCEQNQYRASVIVNVVIDDRGNAKSFSGAADAFSGNAEPEYARHAVALAETRAEGRALKRILRLRKVNAAEEIVDSSKIVEQKTTKEGMIGENQCNFVDILCKPDKANINVEEFVKSEHSVKNIYELTYDEAAALCNKLADYRNKRIVTPPAIIGYDKTWKESFG